VLDKRTCSSSGISESGSSGSISDSMALPTVPVICEPALASRQIGDPPCLLLSCDDLVLECRSSLLKTGQGVGVCMGSSSSLLERFLIEETFDGLSPKVEEDGTCDPWLL
jgi:hypothetical protein